MAHPVTILIPAFNQLAYCEQCIGSLLAHTETPFKLVLVDNGSTDGVGEFFESIENATVIHSDQNLGFAGGVNLGLDHAEGHVCLLNSDTIVPRGWLSRLCEALEQSESIGMVGPMSNHVSGMQLLPDLMLGSVDEINTFSDQRHADFRGQLLDVERLIGFCLLVRDDALRKAGTFDERFGIGNFEDDDYGLRVRQAGYRLCVALDCFVFHYGSRTFAGMGIEGSRFADLLERNAAAFTEKWKLAQDGRAQTEQIAAQLHHQAHVALEQGDTNAAVRLFAQAISMCPSRVESYGDLGAVLWELGEQDRAYRLFKRAVELAPDDNTSRANLIDAANALNRDDEIRDLLAIDSGRYDG